MEELLAYTSSHVCLICFLLALTFIFSKIKMFKLLFILFVIKQRNIGCHYLFSQANYCRTRESWVVITEIEIIFACIYFCELKKSYFASTYFCEWQVFENFEFINFTPKEKRIRKRQFNHEICGSCFCEEKRKSRKVTMKDCCYWWFWKKPN